MRHASVALTDSVYSHYQIDDLSLALNSKHPLISEGLGLEDLFNLVEQVVRETGICQDKRVKATIVRSGKNLSINIHPFVRLSSETIEV